MRFYISFIFYFLFIAATNSQEGQKVTITTSNEGQLLLIDGQKFMVNGMNWDYIPIGTDAITAQFWNKSDDIIKAALEPEMLLLQNMGVNTIRQYSGIPARWIKYIYEQYNIYTILNHSFGRYGLTKDGTWIPITEYDDLKTKKILLKEVTLLAQEYKNTPGLLMYLLGNENNYGLFWQGAETENFPDEEELREYVGKTRARPMYNLMNEAAKKMKSIDGNVPVAICNGDVLFVDIIAEECKDVDIFGTNVYRGASFRDIFQVVKDKLNIPILFMEFGADAFNAISKQEDQAAQAYYMLENWREIYENAAGAGGVGNSIGGCTFQFSDGWWKNGFDDRENSDLHDDNASWSNGGYQKDYKEGQNNMNEEWFGICAKGPTDNRGLYTSYPRAAYYVLKDAHSFDPYQEGANISSIRDYFSKILIMDAVLKARGDQAALESKKKVRMSSFRAELSTFNTGGNLITTPDNPDVGAPSYPDQTGFDHMQSMFIGIETNPASNFRANLTLNVLGNVADNPIDEIFYENVVRADGAERRDGNVRLYNAEIDWRGKMFDLKGFYRTGHFHWQYEGDFFGLYPEANYGPFLDLYNGEISGLEVEGKEQFEGFKFAFGPQLWWGANPAFLAKYTREIGNFDVTGVFHNDIDNADAAISSIAVPVPRTRRATLHVARDFGKLGIQLGGIWGGQPLNGRSFQITQEENGELLIYNDKIQPSDNWGAKGKVEFSSGPINWYAQGSVMGLVANGSGDRTLTFTGWRLKDTGSGNQSNVLSGFTYSVGNFQIAPNFLWQKPLVGPMPNGIESPGRLRNIQDDPFAVRANRETWAGELMITFDPTPGTWMYQWDNNRNEDAKLAVSAGFVYRHHPTTQDAAIGFLNNRTSFAFPRSVPAVDLWESNIRVISKLKSDVGVIANFLLGTAQANGDSERTINRYGMDLLGIYKNIKINGQVKINDWGPYDYHRDFNLTYPLQVFFDVSTSLGNQDWLQTGNTQFGIATKWRSLNEFSPRYLPNDPDFIQEPGTVLQNGSEWEIKTYLNINIGN